MTYGVFRHRALLVSWSSATCCCATVVAMFGVLWIFLGPLLMLSIFAFVFGQIFPGTLAAAA